MNVHVKTWEKELGNNNGGIKVIYSLKMIIHLRVGIDIDNKICNFGGNFYIKF